MHPAGYTIFSAWLLAELIIRRLLLSSLGYIFSPFNALQRLSTLDLTMVLKRVEMSFHATFGIFLHGRSRGKVRMAPFGLKRSVRVQGESTPEEERRIAQQERNSKTTKLFHGKAEIENWRQQMGPERWESMTSRIKASMLEKTDSRI